MRCFYVLKKWSSTKLSLNRDLSLNKMSLNRDCTVIGFNSVKIEDSYILNWLLFIKDYFLFVKQISHLKLMTGQTPNPESTNLVFFFHKIYCLKIRKLIVVKAKNQKSQFQDWVFDLMNMLFEVMTGQVTLFRFQLDHHFLEELHHHHHLSHFLCKYGSIDHEVLGNQGNNEYIHISKPKISKPLHLNKCSLGINLSSEKNERPCDTQSKLQM